MLKLALVANEPPPYRIPVFNRIASHAVIQFQVIFCCRHEPNRHWDYPPITFDHVYLRENIRNVNGRYIHHNPDVITALNRFAPDVVIGNGFNPTHLYAMLWCAARRRPYIPMTDGTLVSEKLLSPLHSLVRRQVYKRAAAFIAASQGGMQLYQSYSVPRSLCYQSCLCIDNDSFRPAPDALNQKRWDFIFCGRFEPSKQPGFAMDVALRCAELLGRKIRLLFVGAGSLDSDLRARAEVHKEKIDICFHGFATQAELPGLYQSARIFLFPTQGDVWGVVANEACAAGLPVIVSPHAGVAGELIVEGQNGYVCDLELENWASCAAGLLSDPVRQAAFGQRSMLLVAPYCFDQAAEGMIQASLAAKNKQRKNNLPLSRPA